MSRRDHRVGIERKILTSILVVGILPMGLALIVGYLTARVGQSNAVQQTLLTAAQKTSVGILRETAARARVVSNLAQHESIVALITDPTPGVTLTPADLGPVAAWLSDYSVMDEESPSKLSLYDAQGAFMASTDEAHDRAELNPTYPRELDAAQYCDFGPNPDRGGFTGTMIAPVRTGPDGDTLGYLIAETGVNSQLQYVMGMPTTQESIEVGTDAYQVAVMLENFPPIYTTLSYDTPDGHPTLDITPPNMPLSDILVQRPESGSVLLKNFITAEEAEPIDVLLAYQRLGGLGFGIVDIYFVAYRPTADVFSSINTVALQALLGCILFIAVLCVNAYRNVHNNIVRPVSLLNEGAQIIRQGDFDLKLKIGTRDEIEELATSFNKMAQALSRNMQQLETSEEKYRNLVTSMRDGIYQTDGQGIITFLNPAAMDILGFDSVESGLEKNLRHMFLEPVEFDAAVEEMDPIGPDVRARSWMKRWDGRTICVEITRNPLYDEKGDYAGMEGILRDVTTSVQLEEEARARSERISAINQIANVINSSLEAGRLYESLVAELRKTVDFDYASVALLADSGIEFDGRQLWPDEEVDTGYTFSLDGQTSYAAWVAKERRCLLVDDLREDRAHYAKQFPEYVLSCLCVPLYATGRIIGTLNLGARVPAAFTSATVETLEQMAPHLAVAIRNAQLLVNLQLSLEEVTRAREKLFEANEELKSLDELKTNLLSNVSHELRTPLVSVMGYTDMILNGKAGPVNKTQQEYLEISLRSVEKLVTLIENLLDFSRLHRGDERLVFDTFDLADCARSSMQIVQPIADSRNIKIILTAPDAPIPVDGDKSKMGQVFNNLLSNAVKFNKNGGEVEIVLAPSSEDVGVTVRDTGIGIPDGALDKVFTRFYQYDGSSTRKYGGTGIGLAIAQDIVRLHGSHILVSSVLGEGTTFTFALGLASTKPKIDTVAEIHVPDETLTLVEMVSSDRPLIVQARKYLVSENMDLIHASNVDRALALLDRHSPDCILLDLDGPEDEETFQEILDRHPETTPIIILTNNDVLYDKYRSSVAARIKRSFRKSTLLGGIHNAMSKAVSVSEPIGEKVLCVDDDPEVLTFMRRCLETEGYELDQCGTGEEALQRLASGDYGLVLLDVAMPGMDGWEVCEKIRANPALEGLKIYMVTAKPIERNVARMRDNGVDGFLLKPFPPEDLVQLVQGLELGTAAK